MSPARPGPARLWLPAFWAVAALCLAWQLALLFGWLGTPILDEHGFRQTQTALSAYWLLQGGPFFAYETPVLGSPWSIPFELPVYQAVVALVARAGVPLDPAGRLVSVACFVAGVVPLRMLWRDLRLAPCGLPIACALLLAAPIYTFWNRTFMIESCAWVLALGWLALFVRLLRGGGLATALAGIAVGLLAMGTKATTAPPFALLAGLCWLPRLGRWLRAGLPRRELPLMLLEGSVLLLPFVGAFAWVVYADQVKLANPIGRTLTSAALAQWNWGKPGQRFGYDLWGSVVRYRVTADMFGRAWPLAALAILAAALRGREARAAAALLGAFVTAFLLFPNLHFVHNYYQYANAAFFVVAAALGLGAVALRWPPVAAGVLLVLLAGQVIEFHAGHWTRMTARLQNAPTYRIALAARERLPADGSLLVFGDDWASTIPYYAQRKALVLPTLTNAETLRAILQDPQAHLAGTRFAGVVSCTRDGAPVYAPALQAPIDAFLAGRAVLAEVAPCRLLAAQRGPG